jgi:predicted DNA-binding transcriptional regulator AlpA
MSQPSSLLDDRYLSAADIKQKFGVTTHTAKAWAKHGFPEPIRLGHRTLRWSERAIAAFLATKQSATVGG